MLKEEYSLNLKEMKSFVAQVIAKKISRTVIEEFNNTYELTIDALSPKSLYERAEIIDKRVKRQISFESGYSKAILMNNWNLGEKNLLFCTLIYYLTLKKISIQSITEKDLLPLKKIFITKDITTLLFQAKHLLSNTSFKKSQWLQEDIQILKALMTFKKEDFKKSQRSLKWKEVSYDIFRQSTSGEFYSARECRQMWVNHLNPQLMKTTWSNKEDIELFMTISQLGCKWSLISKKMGGLRTEHMVKNRTKSIIHRYIKKKVKKIENRHITYVLQILRENEPEISQKRQGQSSLDATEKENLFESSQEKVNERDMELEGLCIDLPSNQIKCVQFDDPYSRLVLIQNMDEHWQYNEQAHSFDFFSNLQSKYQSDLSYHLQ